VSYSLACLATTVSSARMAESFKTPVGGAGWGAPKKQYTRWVQSPMGRDQHWVFWSIEKYWDGIFCCTVCSKVVIHFSVTHDTVTAATVSFVNRDEEHS